MRGDSLRSTFRLARAYGVRYTADYGWRSVERPRISLNGMVLTVSRGNMSNVVFRTVCGHHIFKLAGKISGSMTLEQVVQQDGIVCSVCVRQKRTLRHCAGILTSHVLAVVVVIDRLKWSEVELGRPQRLTSRINTRQQQHFPKQSLPLSRVLARKIHR